MTAKETEALLRRWFEEVWVGGREELIAELMAEDAVVDDLAHPGVRTVGREEFLDFYRMVRGGFSELAIRRLDAIAVANRAAFRVDFEALHSGKFWGIPATFKRVRYSVAGFVTVKDGRFQSGWNLWDQLGLLKQLGVVP